MREIRSASIPIRVDGEVHAASSPPRRPGNYGRGQRRARDLHPGAWWLWAIGMATAASRTTNPLLLVVIVSVTAFVVHARRSDAPWALGFRAYLALGAFIVAFRVVFRVFFDTTYGEHVLFTLPQVPLPEIAAGIRIGGPVSAEGLLAALYDAMRLATIVVCIGAANVLANPKRLLKSVPSALYEVGAAVTVALTVAPQLIESAVRVTRARRLRGDPGRRTHWFKQVVVPVMTDALDRSLMLAAAMDSRGYGAMGATPRHARRSSAVLVLAGLLGVCIGIYGLLDASTPGLIGVPLLIIGLVMAVAGFVVADRRVARTRYRPDEWHVVEWAVAVTGAVAAFTMVIAAGHSPVLLNPPVQPITWPQLPVLATVGVLVGLVPAFISPPPRPSGHGTASPGWHRSGHRPDMAQPGDVT